MNNKIANKLKKKKRILILGGFGYGNVGDEAQVSATINELKNRYPDYIITVLTPNEGYTYNEHNKCNLNEAPRIAFYDQDRNKLHNLYSINNKNKKSVKHYIANEVYKIRFVLRFFWIYINSFLINANLPTFFLSARRVSLLYEISKSDIIYYSGGGYLTGKTLTRLWDGVFFVKIANVFKKPVVFSGQTIGVWETRINRILAKWAFKDVKAITLRDPEDSINSLNEIGLSGENIFVTCDDALFCEKIDDKIVIDRYLMNSGLKEEDIEKGYVTLNIHYWGIETEKGKKEMLSKINNIVNVIKDNCQYNILLIPMTPSDEKTINEYIENYYDERVYKFEYDYNFRVIRGIISRSKICVTMKHHPIIFSIGEKVPVISLSFSNYYEHKNIGALKLFGLEKFNVKLEKEDYLSSFKTLFTETLNNKDRIIENLDNEFEKIKIKKEKFFDYVEKYLEK